MATAPAPDAHGGAAAPRVVLTGGGTAGHVYPCLSLYEILRRHGLAGEAVYLGVRGRAEEEIVPRHGLPLRRIASAPFAGTTLVARLAATATIARGVLASIVHLVRFRPRLVIAAGGYVSAPVILAAFLLKPLLRLRIVLDEQNLVPGLLNKFASLFADVVLVSFKETAYFIWNNRCVMTGYPVRRAYLDPAPDPRQLRQRLGIEEDEFLVVVAGGSMGARSINRSLAAALPELSRIPRLRIVHSIGLNASAAYDAVRDTIDRAGASLGPRFDPAGLRGHREDGTLFYEGRRYIDDLFDYQRAADLVVSRSGAGSLAEVLALGKPALLVPKRGLPGDHQELNAIAVAEQGGAEVLFERRDTDGDADQLDPGELSRRIARLAADSDLRDRLARSAAGLYERGMERSVVRAVQGVIERSGIDTVSQVIEPRFVRFQRQFDSLVRHLDVSGRESSVDDLYRRFYEIRLDEYLESEDWLLVNRGIKLVGALRSRERYGWIRDSFDGFRGYLKRNALTALGKAEAYEPFFAELIVKGLDDGYYETRRAAIELYRRFHGEIGAHEEIERRILRCLERVFESWEVRAEAIIASVLFLDQPRFLGRMIRFRASRRIRLREALLEAISVGLRSGRFDDIAEVRLFVKNMLITTSSFQPHFRVRARFVRVVEQLERMR